MRPSESDELAALADTLTARTRTLLGACIPAEHQVTVAPQRLGSALRGVSQGVNAVLEVCCRSPPGEAECDGILRMLRAQVFTQSHKHKEKGAKVWSQYRARF